MVYETPYCESNDKVLLYYNILVKVAFKNYYIDWNIFNLYAEMYTINREACPESKDTKVNP
jgi:hypothetical protein